MTPKEYIAHIEKDKNIEKLSEQEQKEIIVKNMEYEKQKEMLFLRIEKAKNLSFLKSLIERGLIGVSTAKQVLDDTNLDTEAILEIFTKIDEIESMQDVDVLFPKIYRISQEEYVQAMEDSVFREQILMKINDSLWFIHSSLHPNNTMGILGSFFGFMTILDKNLVRIQENTIDIKRSLQ